MQVWSNSVDPHFPWNPQFSLTMALKRLLLIRLFIRQYFPLYFSFLDQIMIHCTWNTNYTVQAQLCYFSSFFQNTMHNLYSMKWQWKANNNLQIFNHLFSFINIWQSHFINNVINHEFIHHKVCLSTMKLSCPPHVNTVKSCHWVSWK